MSAHGPTDKAPSFYDAITLDMIDDAVVAMEQWRSGENDDVAYNVAFSILWKAFETHQKNIELSNL